MIELALLAAATAIAGGAGPLLDRPETDVLAAIGAIAMGVQNAVVRRLAVPDLTTTVLTMTLTGIAADLRGHDRGPTMLRRVLALAAMLVGAAAGALLVLHVTVTAALGLAVAALAVTAAGTAMAARRTGEWRSG